MIAPAHRDDDPAVSARFREARDTAPPRIGRPRIQDPAAWDMIRCFKTVTTMIAAAVEERYG